MLDIDNFKQINDFYGHPAGDKLIVMLSSYLLKQIRKYDTLCRLAGDEFLILLPQTNLQESGYIAENLRKSVSDRVFYIDGLPISVTASFGLATLHLNGELSLSETIRQKLCGYPRIALTVIAVLKYIHCIRCQTNVP
jgi:diguanylate cyclase (GGDEF)-like protein